ncbi:MAG: thioredoxin domain-containing protein [Candidatus Peribacteraceae bacterium]
MPSPHEKNDNQNVWFGISMFLMGIIAGAVLTVASGTTSFQLGKKNVPKLTAPTPTAQNPVQPSSQASVQDRMLAIARDIGLPEDQFNDCVGSDKYKQKVADEMSGGGKAGINGTPGNIIYDLKTKNGVLVSGARPIGSFQKYIDAMLANPNYVSKDKDVTNAKNVVPVDVAAEHIRGNKDARLAIIEYSDFQCPFCRNVHPTYQQLIALYGDKIMWVYRHFPLGFHPDAEPFAIGSECAAELGGSDAFWSFADKVMQGA